ncbi:MAG: hypothetical protein KAT00_08200, partial [Planctomycetes bacterium]|nr:hypothetical protein [Planctomycetota bacterium]
NAASTTAVLSLSSARLARGDIRSVILMDREILIGPGSTSHVRMGDLDETVALFIRGGRLAVRTKERIEVDGGSYNANDGLAMNRPIRIGPMSVVLAEMKE